MHCMGVLTVRTVRARASPAQLPTCRDIVGTILYIRGIVIVCCPCWAPLCCMGDDDGNYGCEFLGCTDDYDGQIPSVSAPVTEDSVRVGALD
eukprot:6256428-Prymnesium_polylepis.1